jgi:hypothetical protein
VISQTSSGLIFGIHPFGVAGKPDGTAAGKADDFSRIGPAILALKGAAKEFLVRTYVIYSGADSGPRALSQISQFARIEVSWDMVICFRDQTTEIKPWLQLIRDVVDQFGSRLHSLQITNEGNLNLPGSGDGSSPNVCQALVQGLLAARERVRAQNSSVRLGFNAIPSLNDNDTFWSSLASLGGRDFPQALDYVGLDLYPDVFGPPIALESLGAAVRKVLKTFRQKSLPLAGISSAVPIRIAENGWPTGPSRPYDRQALALEAIIRTVHDTRHEFNITHYELFGLRDADSSNDNLFFQFGILRDDYTPKPAFETYKNLIRELGS